MKGIICEVYSRCCGYFRPVNQWNVGKQSEFKDRVNYKIPEIKPEYRASTRKFGEFDEKRILENANKLSQSGIFDKIMKECKI